MDKPRSKQLEDDVMQALESLRAMLDKTDEPLPSGSTALAPDDGIPTLNTVVARPTTEPAGNTSSLLDAAAAAPPSSPKIDPTPAQEKQLVLPEVTELDAHHGVGTEASTPTPTFEDYWVKLEPKLKQAAKACFDELFAARDKE